MESKLQGCSELLIISVNNLPNSLSLGTECRIFVDDTKIARNIYKNDEIKILQNDINQLFNWGKLWGLKFNPQI